MAALSQSKASRENSMSQPRHIEAKLDVLVKLAKQFNQAQVTWQIGGSCLLYLHQCIDSFADLDILIANEDAKVVDGVLATLGKPIPKTNNPMYRSDYFASYEIQGVAVDVMAGFQIQNNDQVHRYVIPQEKPKNKMTLLGQDIYLGSLQDWKILYQWMGREERVQQIDNYLKNNP